MNINWYVWRPVIKQVATYSEIMMHWTLKDLADCHEALDVQEAADRYYQQELERIRRQT